MKKPLPDGPWLLPLAFALLCAAVSAPAALVPTEWRHRQEFTVAAPGVVRVELTDATFDAARPDLADLRLLDPAGRETALALDRPVATPARVTRPADFDARLDQGRVVLTIATGTRDALASILLLTPHPHFLRSARVEVSDDRSQWAVVDEGVPLFRQWGAEKLDLDLGGRPAAWVRVTIAGAAMPFTGARLGLAAGPAAGLVPVGARIVRREEFAGETVLTVALDGRHAPLAALEIETPEPLFMRRVTVGIRDVRDLVPGERTVGEGTLFRVAADGVRTRAQLRLDFSHTPLAPELLVHVQNGDSPPLAVTGLHLKRRAIALRFHAAAAGRHTLLSGNPQAGAPRYDLAALAGDLQAATATTLTPGPLQETPDYQPRASLAEPPLPDVPLTGAPLDPAGWPRRKPVRLTQPGVQELELDPAVLAGARADFADLRLLRAGHQIPYLLERTALARPLALSPGLVPDPKRPTVSVWRLDLPHESLPLLRLAIASDTRLFERTFRLYERIVAGDGRTYEHTLAAGTWHRTPEPGSPGAHVFVPGDRPRTGTLFLETDNGDNPAITLESVKAEYAVVRLVFKTAETDGFVLAYGNLDASAPRYDLGLVAVRLLTASRSPAHLGAEEERAEGFARGALRHLRGGVVFWGALALVVIVLLVTISRLLPKAPPPA